MSSILIFTSQQSERAGWVQMKMGFDVHLGVFPSAGRGL